MILPLVRAAGIACGTLDISAGPSSEYGSIRICWNDHSPGPGRRHSFKTAGMVISFEQELFPVSNTYPVPSTSCSQPVSSYMHDRQVPLSAFHDWVQDHAPWGILVTDREFRITFANKWLRDRLPWPGDTLIDRPLSDVISGLASRGLDRYYRQALDGESRILSHKFHRYLIPMKPAVGGSAFTLMQQSAKIYPLTDGTSTVGTVTVIEDVTERVLREAELNSQVQARDTLLLKDRLTVELQDENSTLKESYDTLRAQGEEILEAARIRDRFIHQIIASQEEERKRVARNIHDHLGQELTALRFALSALEVELTSGGDPQAQLDKCKALASAIDSEVGFLSSELRPTGLEELGLVQSLIQFVDEWAAHFNLTADLHSSGMSDVEIPAGVAINIYRIAQEALNNISKHSQATLVNVLVENQDGAVTLIVEDNGVGFVPENENLREKSGHHGFGIIGMHERAALIQGSLEIESAPGRGTAVFLRVPLPRN
jgi:signal transduction histidine kinase